MFHAADLLAGARAPKWVPDSGDQVAELIDRVRGRRRGVEIPNAPALFLGRDPKRLADLTAALEPYREDPCALAAIAHTIVEGDVLFVGPAQGGGRRTYRLASVVLDPEGEGSLVELSIAQHRHGKPGRDTTCDVSLSIKNAEEEAVRSCLRSIYLSTERAHEYILHRGRARAPVAFWAGTPQRNQGLPDRWADELAALSALDGYELRMDPTPHRSLTTAVRRLHDARPELVFLWRPMLSSATVYERLRSAAGDTLIHEVDTTDPTEALEEAELVLQEKTVAFERYQSSGPTTVAEALALAQKAAEHLVFLPSAQESANASPYARPKAVLDSLLALDEIAGEYAAGEQGSLKDACDRRALNFATGISQTAKTKYRASYQVGYEGDSVMLGPHIRFGHGSPRTCARIYWHLDKAKRRFVVGHVGKHLPDATGGI